MDGGICLCLGINGLCALIAMGIGSRKNEAGKSFVVGLLLGPLGVLLAMVSQGDRWPCPHCSEPVLSTAKVCPHCGRDIVRRA
jgi:predicted RNA-binding Zn-ribbon protein involved in translation (DUF1610 family)